MTQIFLLLLGRLLKTIFHMRGWLRFSRLPKDGGLCNHGSHNIWIIGCLKQKQISAVSCHPCNEPRTDDSPPADIALSNPPSLGKKGFEAGPTHVLVVRGLDENADEEMLRYEFSKHAPIKYDAVGWAPKEYNPDDNQSAGGQEQASGEITVQKDGSAPQSGFVWDEASGYYYDAASGFYFDGNTVFC